MDAFEREMEDRCGCSDDGFDEEAAWDVQDANVQRFLAENEIEIELEPEERATITANQWIRAGAKILGFPNGEVR